MKTRRLFTMIGALLLCSAGVLPAGYPPTRFLPRARILAEQPAPPADTSQAPAIRLLAGTFVPSQVQESNAPETEGNDRPGVGVPSRAQYLVQFRGPITPAWRAELEETGAEILDYIPDYAYKIALGDASPDELQQLPGVTWVGPFLSDYRVSPQLASAGQQIVRVQMDLDQVDHLLASLPDLGANLIGQDGGTLVVAIDAAHLIDLGRLEGVQWISPLEVPRASTDVAAGEIQASRAWTLGFQGDGQAINVTDAGLDTGTDYPQITGDMHLDLDSRVAHLRSWPISGQYDGLLNNPRADDGAADVASGHGTSVAGATAGNGARSGGRYRGMASP